VEGGGEDLCTSRVVDVGGLASEDIFVTLNIPSCPTMLVGPSGVSNRGEKGDIVGCID